MEALRRLQELTDLIEKKKVPPQFKKWQIKKGDNKPTKKKKETKKEDTHLSSGADQEDIEQNLGEAISSPDLQMLAQMIGIDIAKLREDVSVQAKRGEPIDPGKVFKKLTGLSNDYEAFLKRLKRTLAMWETAYRAERQDRR